MLSTRALTAVTVLTLCAVALPETPSRIAFTPACPNTFPHEPVVVYEVSGGTLTGPVDYFLAVYSDGSARYSSSLGGAGTGSSQSVSLGSAAASELRQDLIDAGALDQCDQPDFTNDVPLSTLTILRGAAGQHASTFSWFTPDGDVVAIEAVLSSFIAAHFVPLGGGSGF